MTISVIGINHKTAPVALREKVAFSPDNLNEALQQLQQGEQADEAVIVSTCNRTEIYCNTRHQANELVDWLAKFHAVEADELHQFVYHYEEQEAVNHLLRVACGLDSLVLGEPQILGQLKQSFADAKANDVVDVMLQKLFQHTFSVAKQVRTDTEIGVSAVSVAYAAVNLAKQIFGDLRAATVLLIGAGETIELVAKHLSEQGVNSVIVANRTIAKAQALAKSFDGKSITLSQIANFLPEADIVISSTASPVPIVGKGLVEGALKTRKYKPIFLVDLAVPRDVESQVDELNDAYLYTVDDLQKIVEKNRQNREQAAQQAELIVRQQTEQFYVWLRSLNAVDVIRDFRQQAEQQKQEALNKALKQLQTADDAEAVLAEFANKLTNSLIHPPTKLLKKAAESGDDRLLSVIAENLGVQGKNSVD